MSWPIPDPDAIADRAATVYETAPALAGIDARSPNRVATANTRIVAMAAFDAYLHQAGIERELWPDTAVDNLLRLAAIYGVQQVAAQPSAGNLLVTGTATTPIAAGTTFSAPNGYVYATAATAALAGSTPVALPLVCTTTGAATNIAAGVVLTAVSPITGLSPQTGTVDSNGLTGGADIETLDALRARLLQRIRSDAAAGNSGDWASWVRAAIPNVLQVAVLPRWTGIGNVGLAVVMAGPAAPTAPQLAAISAYVNDPSRRPVTSSGIVLAATLTPVNVQLVLNPDTSAARAAALAALQEAFALDATVGGAVFTSRLDSAISAGDGEYSHERIAPAADVVMTATQFPVLGTVTWGA